MKRKDLEKLGIMNKTLHEYDEEVDHVRLIVSDEFNSKTGPGDYRDSAIQRFVENKLPFYNEQNITFNVMHRYIHVECPYCGKMMKNSGCGGGNGHHSSMEYKCKCGAKASLCLDHGNGVVFTPKEKK